MKKISVLEHVFVTLVAIVAILFLVHMVNWYPLTTGVFDYLLIGTQVLIFFGLMLAYFRVRKPADEEVDDSDGEAQS